MGLAVPAAFPGIKFTLSSLRVMSATTLLCGTIVPPPLSKQWLCLSYSGPRDHINSVPNLFQYEMYCNGIRHGFGDNSANYMESWTHLL